MYHIHERSFLKIILCCSFFISANAFAIENAPGRYERVEVFDNGRYMGIRGINQKTSTQHGRVWQAVFDKETSRYAILDAQDLTVRHAKTGASSAARIGATVEATVSRPTVLSRAYGLVTQGARIAASSRGNLYIGGALLAYEAYQAVKGDLESEGYIADESGTFLKTYNDALCIKNWQGEKKFYSNCIPLDSSLVRAYEKGGQSREEAEFLLKSRTESEARKYFEQLKARDSSYKDYIFKECVIGSINARCHVDKKGDWITPIIFERLQNRQSEVLTPEKFLEIATPAIDRNPTPFVEGAGRPDYSEDVQVAPGTSVTIGPVTGPDSKPVQIQITFGRDSNGKTTATVTTTPRPDLTPGSPAAPKTNPTPTPGENGKPGSQPDPNSDGKPGSQPDPTPDGSTSDKPKPDPDDSPGGKDKPKPDDKPDPDGKDNPKKDERPKEDDKPKEDGGLLCKVFPNILACDELPEKEEPNLEIPQETIDLNFTPDNTFSEYGECPAPVTFQALGAEYKISLEPACNLAAMMRPFIIAMAWLVASFFVARVVRNNA